MEFCEIFDDRRMLLSIFFGGPSFAFKPSHPAADSFGGDDVFAKAVANDEHLLRAKTECLDAEHKDFGVGLTDAYNGAFDDVGKIAAQVEVG